MFSSVPDQKPVGFEPIVLSLAAHAVAAMVLVYGASVAGNNGVALRPMITPEMVENMLYLPPDLNAHASVQPPTAAPAPQEEKPALTLPTQEPQQATLEDKPEPEPEQAKPQTSVSASNPAEAAPAAQPSEQGGYMRANVIAPQRPNMAAMMAYMAQHHRVSDPQPIYTPMPTAAHGKLPPEFGGDVLVDLVIDAEGKVAEASLVQPLIPSLTEDILSVVRQWRFVPASYNGQSMATRHQFRLHVG